MQTIYRKTFVLSIGILLTFFALGIFVDQNVVSEAVVIDLCDDRKLERIFRFGNAVARHVGRRIEKLYRNFIPSADSASVLDGIGAFGVSELRFVGLGLFYYACQRIDAVADDRFEDLCRILSGELDGPSDRAALFGNVRHLIGQFQKLGIREFSHYLLACAIEDVAIRAFDRNELAV